MSNVTVRLRSSAAALPLEVIPFPAPTLIRAFLEQFLGALRIVIIELAMGEDDAVRVEKRPLVIKRDLGDARWRFTSESAARSRDWYDSATPKPTSVNTARPITPRNAAAARLRRHHRHACSDRLLRRATIGRSVTKFSRSADRASAVAYRSPGSLAIAFKTIVSRSRGTRGSCFRGDGGWSWITWSISFARVAASNAGRKVNSSYKRHAQTVKVTAAVGPALEPLRRHVAKSADDVAGLGRSVGTFELRQSEVRDPNVAVDVEQEVRRLDIAVQHALAVGMCQRLGNLNAQPRHGSIVARVSRQGENRVDARCGRGRGRYARARTRRRRRRKSR